ENNTIDSHVKAGSKHWCCTGQLTQTSLHRCRGGGTVTECRCVHFIPLWLYPRDLSLVLIYVLTVICIVHIVLIYLFTAICSVHIVTNHGSAEYLLWLFIKHNTLSQWHGLYALVKVITNRLLPSHTCINSVPTQNNDMQLEQ